MVNKCSNSVEQLWLSSCLIGERDCKHYTAMHIEILRFVFIMMVTTTRAQVLLTVKLAGPERSGVGCLLVRSDSTNRPNTAGHELFSLLVSLVYRSWRTASRSPVYKQPNENWFLRLLLPSLQCVLQPIWSRLALSVPNITIIQRRNQRQWIRIRRW